MPSLRDIKRRIKSVQNTKKITQAMRLVAAAKVKKAETQVKASRPFANELVKTFSRLLATEPEISNRNLKTEKAIDNYPALLEERDLKTVGLLIVSSDRGLAGAYTANLMRRATARINELKRDGLNVKLFIVGQKGINILKRGNYEIAHTYTRMPAIPTPGESFVIAEDIAEHFVSESIDRIEVITTSYKSMLSYEVQLWQVLPAKITSDVLEEESKADFIIEPSVEGVLQKLVPLYLSNRIYQALLEAAASELAARMAAMSAASSNAEEMIQKLTIVYNKARQASITQELLEVVSGAEALR